MEKEEVATRVLGARSNNQGTEFRLWAPQRKQVQIVILEDNDVRLIPLSAEGEGFFSAFVEGVGPGTRYLYQLEENKRLPDPVSRFQPEGPLGPSEVVGAEFPWTDTNWKGLPLNELVIYELHVGTFSAEGTFDGVIAELSRLKDLGINAIEIMPVSQFSGERNWGYDGAYPHAVQSTYGGPEGLKRLVNACHHHGLAVILDVVYNHLGPEGNFLPEYFPVFQDRYHTPWGQAINFDGSGSDGVRKYFLQSVWQWLDEYHIDGLRLDAIQTIFDTSAKPFLEELGHLKNQIAAESGRSLHIIAETDANDPKVIRSAELGGLGLDAHWNDDFHHCLHVLLTGENQGYYSDYNGIEDLKRLYTHRVVYDWRYSQYHDRHHGRSYKGLDPNRLVICSQNHDQIGNRMLGERLSTLVDFESLKLAAAAVFCSPFLPMIYMGEEYGENHPFLYFVSHIDKDLNKAVREGRRREFQAFTWKGEAPDPVDEDSFQRSKLSVETRKSPQGLIMQSLYKKLISVSKEIRRNASFHPEAISVESFGEKGIQLFGDNELVLVMNFGQDEAVLRLPQTPIELIVDTFLYQPHSDTESAYLEKSKAIAGGELRVAARSAILLRGKLK